MQVAYDETYCGPLCQHPSCWQSQRRCNRGLPRTAARKSQSDSEDEGLPTQKVMNLLEYYGDDPRDRYPSKLGGRPIQRAGSIANLTRARTRDSFPRVRAPNATPASGMRSSVRSASSQKDPMRKVEVQEVFDLDDLQSDWHETFQAKKYYVWVPSTKASSKPKPLQPMQSLSVQRSSEGPVAVNPRDLTEDMVPQELEWERMNQVMKHDRRAECKTPTGGQPYSYPMAQDREYNGLYDLLDLPREVLADIVNHIEDRELKSKHEFVEAVIRALPKLEENHTAISLASSNVLLQRPVQLLDGELKRMKSLEPFTSRQVYQLDEKRTPENKVNETPMSRMTERSTTVSGKGEPLAAVPGVAPSVLNKMKPLPAISGGDPSPSILPETTERDENDGKEDEEKKKIPSVALGLPTIPSGIKYTKTFTYSQQDFDFTLCPIPISLQGIDAPLTDAQGVLTPVPQPSSARATVETDRMPNAPVDRIQSPMLRETVSQSTPNHPAVTQMVIHMPKTPHTTPVTRGSTFLTDLGEAGQKSTRHPTVVIQKEFALSPAPPDNASS